MDTTLVAFFMFPVPKMPWRLLLLIGVGILAAPLQAEQDEPADWWSLSPLHRPEVPRLEGGGTEDLGLNVIDRFVIAKQRELGLTMSGEASRQTLIRRVYFDLIGLPPSPEEVRSFVHDERE